MKIIVKKNSALCKMNKIWAHIMKYQTQKVVQYIIKGSILIKSHLGQLEANPMEVLWFFDKFSTQIWAPGRGRARGRAREANMGQICWKYQSSGFKPRSFCRNNYLIWSHMDLIGGKSVFGKTNRKLAIIWPIINQYKPI